MEKRVIGIGGVFFKSKNPKELKEWYAKHLGFDVTDYGTNFLNRKGYTVWSPFEESTEYFAPSKSPFMINFVVEDIEELTKVLKEEGVEFVDEIETFDYGKFVHILDPENNKLELYQPNFEFFEKMINAE